MNPATRALELIAETTAMVSRAARRAAIIAGSAVLIVVLTLALSPPTGFGMPVAPAVLIGVLLAIPAGVLIAFSVSTSHLGDFVRQLPATVSAAASEAVASTVDLAESVQVAVAERRGVRRLLGGIWGLRGLVSRFRDLMGDSMPALAAVSPGFLLGTALSTFAALGVVVLTAIVVMARLVT